MIKQEKNWQCLLRLTSGYRSEAVNRRVGGVATSQHTKGEGCGFGFGDNAKLFNILKKMNFDQLIWEKGNNIQPAWVRVSLKRIGINRKTSYKIMIELIITSLVSVVISLEASNFVFFFKEKKKEKKIEVDTL